MLPECMSRYNLIPYSITVLLLFSADLEIGLNDCPVAWNLNPIGLKILYLALGSVFASKIPAHHSILHMETLRAKLGEVAIGGRVLRMQMFLVAFSALLTDEHLIKW